MTEQNLQISTDFITERGLNKQIESPIKKRLQVVANKTNDAFNSLIDAGTLLASIKQECTSDEFKQHIESIGLPPQRAYEMIRYASFAHSLPAAQRKKLTALNKTKVILLAHAEDEVIEDYLENDEGFEELQGMSVRELKNELNKRKQQTADLNVQNDTLTAQLKEATSKKSRALTGGVIPLYIEYVRNEACALDYKSRLCVDDLQALANDLIQTASSADETDKYLIGFKALYAATNSILNSALILRNQMHEQFPQVIHGGFEPIEQMVEAEALRLAGDMKLISQEHDHERLVREHQREASRPKGRGRPKKTASK